MGDLKIKFGKLIFFKVFSTSFSKYCEHASYFLKKKNRNSAHLCHNQFSADFSIKKLSYCSVQNFGRGQGKTDVEFLMLAYCILVNDNSVFPLISTHCQLNLWKQVFFTSIFIYFFIFFT